MRNSYDTGVRTKQSTSQDELYNEVMREFGQLQLVRNTFGTHWDEIARLILPTSRNTFFYGNVNTQGEKKTQDQVDGSGMIALSRFAAICDSLLTPRNMKWHGLQANNPDIMKDRTVRLWFEQVTNILFKYRYQPIANFSGQNQNNYQSLGAFGTSAMFIDEFDGTSFGTVRGIRYKSIPLGEIFIKENHQGMVDGFIRWFQLTARQAYQKWGPDGTNTFPASLVTALEQNSEAKYNFLHRVCPRPDYDPGRLDARGKPFVSQYVSVEGRAILQEGGYRSFPTAISRYDQTPGETYGRSPAMMALPALKTLNAQKKTFLKQAHRAADPVLLVSDDGIIDMNLRPGAINKGGMSGDGKPLVGVLPTGNIQVNEKMMMEEKSLINDIFLVSIFQILSETPTMTATEVIERTNEKGILLAPTIGRQQSEYLGPMIERELDVLAAQYLIPPMPGLLREAKGEYEVTYTSPLSKAMRAGEAAGFMRTVESVKEIVSITQDASLLDPFDFDTAISDIADINATPASWMASDAQKMAKRKSRAQAQARQEQIQAAPAQAAMMKAQAVQQKAGVAPQQGAAPPQGQ